MTKADFERIAKWIREFEPPFSERNLTDADDQEQILQTRSALAVHFANYLEQLNPRFDRIRFITACTKNGSKSYPWVQVKTVG